MAIPFYSWLPFLSSALSLVFAALVFRRYLDGPPAWEAPNGLRTDGIAGPGSPILPAFGGSLSRFGVPSALYIAEFLGAVLMFIGFLRATRPTES